MNFAGAFVNQKQAARNQNQITARYFLAKNTEKWRGQPHNPRQNEQQANAHKHRHKQADAPGDFLLGFGQLVDQNRNKNNVVDAQHQLKQGQGGKSDPDLRIGQ